MIMLRPYFVNKTSCLYRIRPFFLNEFSTEATVSGTQSTRQEVATHVLDACRTPCIQELTERNHPTSVINYAKKPNSTTHSQLSTQPSKARSKIKPFYSKPLHVSLPDSHHEKVQFQKKPQHASSHQPIQLTRDASSGSSTQNSSRSKADEGQSSLPVYSFMEYKNAPTIMYTKSESEANSLVQTLQR